MTTTDCPSTATSPGFSRGVHDDCAHWHSDRAYCRKGHPILCQDFDADGAVSRVQRTQVGGDHYVKHAIQPWDAMKAWMTPEQFKGFLRGNALKYIARCEDKGGVQDIEKAIHYLQRLAEEMRA